MFKEPIKMNLTVADTNNSRISTLKYITPDGWVVTEDGAMGDHKEDCEIYLNWQGPYIEQIRKKFRMSQQELAWVLGVSRPTVSNLEKDKTELTHRQYLLLQSIRIHEEVTNA